LKKIKQPSGITVTRIYEEDREAMKKALLIFLTASVKKKEGGNK
jgi:hypothetical protein